jgi:hypothetical protein
MRARGIRVSFASDNTRDPFYAYGDMDMLEVMREATRIGHLDHSRDRLDGRLPDRARRHLRLRRAVARARRARRSGDREGAQLDRAFRPPASRPHRAARGARGSTGRCPITPNSTP